MGEMNMCRICTNFASSNTSINLFDRQQRCLLGQIKDVTGCSLRNSKDLPKFICESCIENLRQAHTFRNCCLDSQLYFCSSKYKTLLSAVSKEEITIKIIKDESKGETSVDEIICSKSEGDKNNSLNLKQEHIFEYENTSDEDESCTDPILNDAAVSENEIINSPSSSTLKNSKTKKAKRKKEMKILNKRPPPKKTSPKKDKDKEKTTIKKDKISDYICDQCGNHFTCRHHFQTHLRRHANDKRFQCEVCPNKFFTHSELKRHMRRHTGERPFACQFCERRFTDYSTRVKHERIHTNERPFKCEQCDKAFTTSYVLKNHMLIHTGERSFKCEICEKAFARQVHLIVHYRSISHKQMEEKQTRIINLNEMGT